MPSQTLPYHTRTYLAYLRLTKALDNHRTANPSSPATFTLTLAPYQLYPSASATGEDKHTWYKTAKYDNSEARMQLYCDTMGKLGEAEGVAFDFKTGPIANTLNAHRILQLIQAQHSPAAALRALEVLYKSYFEQGQHPSSPATLTAACLAAGLSKEETDSLVADDSAGLANVKMALREQVGNGVDSVPYVVFEGRKRDFTLIGAKEVAEYEKVLGQVGKESL